MRWWLLVALLLGFAIFRGYSQQVDEEEPYRLVPGDLVHISVLNDASLSGEQLVGPDGYIRLPLIGAVRAAGLTLDELTEHLRQAFSRFIRQPRIVVTLKQFPASLRRVFVLGEVKNPGAYQLPPGIVPSVFDAVALASGFTDNADLTQVRIFQRDGQAVFLTFVTYNPATQPFAQATSSGCLPLSSA